MTERALSNVLLSEQEQNIIKCIFSEKEDDEKKDNLILMPPFSQFWYHVSISILFRVIAIFP